MPNVVFSSGLLPSQTISQPFNHSYQQPGLSLAPYTEFEIKTKSATMVFAHMMMSEAPMSGGPGLMQIQRIRDGHEVILLACGTLALMAPPASSSLTISGSYLIETDKLEFLRMCFPISAAHGAKGHCFVSLIGTAEIGLLPQIPPT